MEPANTAMVVRTDADDDEALPGLQTELQVELAGTRERLGIPDPGSPLTNGEISSGVAELEHLRQAIREQEQAKLEALQEAAELQLKLAAVQVDAAKAKTQYYGVPKSRGALTRAESDLSEITTKLHAAKKELDWEQRSRRAEAIQAAARIGNLEKDLAVATAALQSRSVSHPMRLRIVLGAVAALALAAGIAAFAMYRQTPVSANETLVAERSAPESAPAALKGHSASSTPDFTKSYDRLGQALAAFAGRDPEEVLRQVQQSGGGCGLRWNNGEPSLLFGGLGQKSTSFGDAMTQCAEAVEKLK